MGVRHRACSAVRRSRSDEHRCRHVRRDIRRRRARRRGRVRCAPPIREALTAHLANGEHPTVYVRVLAVCLTPRRLSIQLRLPHPIHNRVVGHETKWARVIHRVGGRIGRLRHQEAVRSNVAKMPLIRQRKFTLAVIPLRFAVLNRPNNIPVSITLMLRDCARLPPIQPARRNPILCS